MKQVKVYTVLSKERENDLDCFSNFEGVFSTYEKAEAYINHFFEESKYGYRYIVSTYLDPFENEIQSKIFCFSIFAEEVKNRLEVSIFKTGFPVMIADMDHLIPSESSFNVPLEFSFFCFAVSEEEAMKKFSKCLNEYNEKHNVVIDIAPYKVDKREYVF